MKQYLRIVPDEPKNIPRIEERYGCDEVATAYGVKICTVWSWIRRGELEAIDLGGAGKGPYVVTPSALTRFEQARATIKN